MTEDTFGWVQQRLEDNKRYAARNTKVPSLLQGLAACSACGYRYYRTSARIASRNIYYYPWPAPLQVCFLNRSLAITGS